MNIYHNHLTLLSLTLIAILLTASCESRLSTEGTGSRSKSTDIKVKVSETGSFLMTKASEASAAPARVFDSEDEDGFVIEEYVSSIDESMANPVTKGTEMTNTGINKLGQSFTVNGWGKVSESQGKPEVATNHLPSLTTTYNGSKWIWDNDAAPKWINENNLHIWSYYPAGKISPEINFDDNTPANNTASFEDYTTDGTDLLIAYNKEAREFEKNSKGKHTYDANGILTDPIIGNDYFNVKFYHALAAVKFELESTTSGADIHSITLCYVNSSKQIVATEGIATTGDCVATGSGTGTGLVSFDWTNLDNRKALHYEYSSGFNGEELFMIPQEIKNIKIIIEFSKYGSTQCYTKIQSLPNVTWDAGYYYTYKIKIGEFHVPGEKLKQLTDVTIDRLNHTGSGGSAYDFFIRPENSDGSAASISIKGVTKMGLVINGYSLPAKTGQTVHMYSNAKADYNDIPGAGSGFSCDFAPVTVLNENMYSFGDGVNETYYDKYIFARTGDHSESLSQAFLSGTKYYVFDTNDKDIFFLYFRPDGGDGSGAYMIDLLGLMVVEVKEDTNIPTNFPLVTWP